MKTSDNPIVEYWNKIRNGEIIVCNKIFLTYQKIISDLENQKEWFYDDKKANHIINFIEKFCKHSKGKYGGKPIVLELWQKAMLATCFGFVDIDGNRKYRFCYLIVGKKNGKSTIASGVGLYLMIADGEPGAEVYSVATKRDQAKIVWSESKRMVNKSPTLRKTIKPLVSELKSDFNESIFKPLASDVDTLDGLNVSGVLADEFHQWKNGKALWDIVVDGIASRENPFVLAISTAGTIREDIYDDIYSEATIEINNYKSELSIDERSLYFIYELDSRDEWDKPECVVKANPGIDTIKNRDILKSKIEKAKKNPALIKNILCKEFNIRETSDESLFTQDEIESDLTFNLSEMNLRYAIGGLDLSSTTDLTCATLLFKIPDDEMLYCQQMYWLPSDLLEQRIKEDKIRYDVWLDNGLLRLSEGNKINYKDVVDWFSEMQNDHGLYIYKIGYDSWNSQYIVDDLKYRFGNNSCESIVQGAKTFSVPLKMIKADLKAKKINYNKNKLLIWNLANASVKIDRNDNWALIKSSKANRRIDGVASLMDAYICLKNNCENYNGMI